MADIVDVLDASIVTQRKETVLQLRKEGRARTDSS